MSPTWRPAGEAGLALLEVLIAAVVVGISAIGVALLLNSGHTFIVAQGDNRLALYLAEQGIESQMAAGFPASGPDNHRDPGRPERHPDLQARHLCEFRAG